jgi:hypothetical protein
MDSKILNLDVAAINLDPQYSKKVKWVMDNFKSMGASEENLLNEEKKMMTSVNYLNECLFLLDFSIDYLD